MARRKGPVAGAGTNHWRDRRVLVTGATGLLGSWLTSALVRRGADVVALVRDWVPTSHLVTSGTLADVTVVRGDVREPGLAERILGEYEADTVFHLAAQTIVGVANENPRSTFETNVQGTWELLEAVRHSGTVRRLVVASSDKAYGQQATLPYTEEAPLQGSHPYDVSKSCADLIAGAYHATYGLPVCVTRCGNLYGGGDLNFNRIVPGTLRSLLRGERPVIRSDGSNLRDYFYVEDGAGAYLLLAEKMERAEVVGEAFNFSNERPITVLDLVRLIIRSVGIDDLPPDVRATAKGEILHQYLDSAKARRLLGWKPMFTLEEGLRETAQWYRNYFEHNVLA